MSETYDIGLGNNDSEIRKKADSDFVSFWDEQAKNLSWFSPWKKTLDWREGQEQCWLAVGASEQRRCPR